MSYQVVRIEQSTAGAPATKGPAHATHGMDESAATEVLVAQKVAHMARAGWAHVATTAERLSAHAERSGGDVLLLIFWRDVALARRPADRATGDSAWVREYPQKALKPLRVINGDVRSSGSSAVGLEDDTLVVRRVADVIDSLDVLASE